MDLRLISYNMNGFPWIDTHIKDVVKWVVEHGNLVAFQEIWIDHAKWAAAFAVHGWSFLRPARENHFAALYGSGLAFAWPNKRWILHDARQYPFLDTGSIEIFVIKGWFQLEITDTRTNKKFRIINTHMLSDIDYLEHLMHSYSHTIRMKQARQLLMTLQQQVKRPTLIVGDLNSEACHFTPYQFLQKDKTPTYPSNRQLLDHCAALSSDNWILHTHRVVEKDWSDHHPVVWHLC